jgi:hypothetical protein
MGFGLNGAVNNVHITYSYRTIVHLGKSYVNAMLSWGKIMRKVYKKVIIRFIIFPFFPIIILYFSLIFYSFSLSLIIRYHDINFSL